MVLITKRACVIGGIEATVSATLRQDARGAIHREGMGARCPSSATEHTDHLILRFQWRPLLRPRERGIQGKPQLRVNVGSLSPRRLVWGACFWSRKRIAWWCWIREPRPTLRVSVGWHAIIGSWKRMGSRGRPHNARERDFALVTGDLVRYAMQ